MNTSRIEHIWPDGHWQEMEFVSYKVGVFDDTSVGYLQAEDNEGDQAHLPNMKSSTIVRCFAKFLEIENVLRESEHGNKASAETMENLQKIRNKIDKLLNPEGKT
mgnify:FL=1|tara:strand:+ start:282 stop:596 length:315 start_codon:yes stop_codon:yes gene_type:complete